jgi:hypothetical protein
MSCGAGQLCVTSSMDSKPEYERKMSGQFHTLAIFIPMVKDSSSYWTEYWVSSRTILDMAAKWKISTYLPRAEYYLSNLQLITLLTDRAYTFFNYGKYSLFINYILEL